MAQNVSYGIGQYTYDPTFEYVTSLGSASAGTKHYIDYQFGPGVTYKDIIIDLPSGHNFKAGETYYMEITVPRNQWYDIEANLKLCLADENNSSTINLNKFQQIKYLYIPAAADPQSIYSNVVLYENNSNQVQVALASDFNVSNSNGNYCTYSLLQNWKVTQNATTTASFSFIFSPKYDFTEPYKFLWIETLHNDNNVKHVEDGVTYSGKYLDKDSVEVSFYKVNNIMPISEYGIASVKSGISTLTGITVDAASRWMFAVNGEEIKLGNSGHYELKDYEITSLGLIVKEQVDWTKVFTIDYEYIVTS